MATDSQAVFSNFCNGVIRIDDQSTPDESKLVFTVDATGALMELSYAMGLIEGIRSTLGSVKALLG